MRGIADQIRGILERDGRRPVVAFSTYRLHAARVAPTLSRLGFIPMYVESGERPSLGSVPCDLALAGYTAYDPLWEKRPGCRLRQLADRKAERQREVLASS